MAKKHKSRKRSTSNSAKITLEATRNPFFNHPLMGRSHHHEKPYKADRKAARIKLRNSIRTTDACDSHNIIARNGLMKSICTGNRMAHQLFE